MAREDEAKAPVVMVLSEEQLEKLSQMVAAKVTENIFEKSAEHVQKYLEGTHALACGSCKSTVH